MKSILLAVTLIASTVSAFAAQAAAPARRNVFENPSGSVQVESRACGKSLCGVIIWANDKAKADAKRGGTDPLVGTSLFRDFSPDGPDRWRGKVFVPDIRRTFSGRITRIDANTLEGRGCLAGGVGCRSQRWVRTAKPKA